MRPGVSGKLPGKANQFGELGRRSFRGLHQAQVTSVRLDDQPFVAGKDARAWRTDFAANPKLLAGVEIKTMHSAPGPIDTIAMNDRRADT